MTERPILFSAPMIRAILSGSKSQTRRVLQNQPAADCDMTSAEWRFTSGYKTTKADPPWMEATKPWPAKGDEIGREIVIAPRRVPCRPGDRLYVREAWRTVDVLDHVAPSKLKDGEAFPVDYTPIRYEADGAEVDYHPLSDPRFGKLRPGMFMPRWASRLTLAVTEVRVQRLQEITWEDAEAEGVWYSSQEYREQVCIWRDAPSALRRLRVEHFAKLWDGLNAARGYGWDANPWVAAICFETHHANIDAMPAREAA